MKEQRNTLTFCSGESLDHHLINAPKVRSYKTHCRHPFEIRNAVIDDNNDLMTKFLMTVFIDSQLNFIEVRPR